MYFAKRKGVFLQKMGNKILKKGLGLGHKLLFHSAMNAKNIASSCIFLASMKIICPALRNIAVR